MIIQELTIQDMYNWAKKHDCLDIPVATLNDKGLHDFENIVRLTEAISDYAPNHDRVLIL